MRSNDCTPIWQRKKNIYPKVKKYKLDAYYDVLYQKVVVRQLVCHIFKEKSFRLKRSRSAKALLLLHWYCIEHNILLESEINEDTSISLEN